MKGRHLLIKRAPNDVGKLYDAVREISTKRFGLLPIAMPPTAVSRVCDFVWDDSKITISEDEFTDIFASELSGYDIAQVSEPSVPTPSPRPRPTVTDNRLRCGTCGRPEVGSETFAKCSHCGRPFCFGHIEPHEQTCPSRVSEPPLQPIPVAPRSLRRSTPSYRYGRHHRHVWSYIFLLLFFILAWVIGYSSPSIGPRDIILLALTCAS